MHHSGTEVAFTSANHLTELLDVVGNVPALRIIVVLESWHDLQSDSGTGLSLKESEVKALGDEKGVKIMDLQECE